MVLKERSVHALRELDQVNKFKRGRNSFSEVFCFQKKNLNMNDCDMNIQTLHECAIVPFERFPIFNSYTLTFCSKEVS